MNDTGNPPNTPPTEDELQRVYPDLANVLLQNGTNTDGTYSWKYDAIFTALKILGHADAAIKSAIQSGCHHDPSGQSFVLASKDTLDQWKSLAIALSGGGLRATIFELGSLVYLALAGELGNVKAFVSVSGGSILAGHLAMHWSKAIEDVDGFTKVSADLIKFTRGDIRNSAMVKWLWCGGPILKWVFRPLKRVAFLEREYRKLFADKTLGDISVGQDNPLFVFVATDTKRQHRVALCRSGIYRFDFDGKVHPETVLADGVHLALAVAASSGFPPVFEALPLGNKELGLKFSEFKDVLDLRDGGVGGNLGVEVLTNLMALGKLSAMRLLVCDAECGMADEPSNGPLAVIDAQGAALSESARNTVRDLGSNALLLRFATRPKGDLALQFRATTALSRYRTDLDAPTWDECYALMLHGAAICAQALSTKAMLKPPKDHVQKTIQAILVGAGCPAAIQVPNEKALSKCGKRRYKRVIVHAILVIIFYFALFGMACELVAWKYPNWTLRPIVSIWRTICPEQIFDKNFETVALQVVDSVCQDSIAKAQLKFVNGELSRFEVVVGPGSSSTIVYLRKTIRSPHCQADVECLFTFRCESNVQRFKPGDKAQIVGRIVIVGSNALLSAAYVDLEECYVECVTPAEH